MHDSTRRLICRAAFFFACVLPTCGVIAWAAAQHWPGSTRQVARELSLRLGMQVTLDDVSYPRPGTMLLTGVALADIELGRPLAWFPALTVSTTSDGVTLTSETADVTPAALPEFWRVLRGSVHSADDPAVRLIVRELSLRSDFNAPAVQWSGQVRARLDRTSGGATAGIGWLAVGADEAKEIRLDVVRNRESAPPVFAWELKTGDASLSCALAAPLAPAIARLGAKCEFHGTLTVQESTSSVAANGAMDWACDVRGELAHVDLHTALSGVLPHELEGRARIDIEEAQWRAGRLNSLRASVTAGPGRIGRSLVAAAAEALSLERSTADERHLETEMYEQLSFAVGMNIRGLALSGIAGGESGAVLVTPAGVLLKTRSPDHPLLAPAALAQLAGRATDPAVPVTAEAQQLIRVLPVSP